MAFLAGEEKEKLDIEKFVFHVVHTGEQEPILLDETPWSHYRDFFLERIRDTLKGNSFELLEASRTRELLTQVVDDPGAFVAVSKELARHFHVLVGADKRIKPGVLIVMSLRVGQRYLFSLIKYEHQKVLSYDIDGATAILKEIQRGFTESPEAMQKSALISLNESGGDVLVIDRMKPRDITNFFRAFLDVKRKYNEHELTTIVRDVAIKTVQLHAQALPDEVTQNVRGRVYDFVQTRDAFDADEYFDAIFGPQAGEDIRKDYRSLLHKSLAEGESFEFSKGSIPKPKKKTFKTYEGVIVKFDESNQDRVSVLDQANEKIISIRTQKIIEE